MDIKILDTARTERLGNFLWVLTQNLIFTVDGKIYTVPKGFVFDGNSTPRILWRLCPPVADSYGEAGIIHDWFYSLDSMVPMNRERADVIHRAVGRYRGAGFIRSRIIYYGLRLFGGGSYKKTYSYDKVQNSNTYKYLDALKRVSSLSGRTELR